MFDPVPATPRLAWQPGLDEPPATPRPDLSFGGLRRIRLDATSWIEHVPAWLSGADAVFADLLAGAAWTSREVVMYDRVLVEPRLTARWSGAFPTALQDIRAALSDRYGAVFDSVGVNLYRDGDDSVAWHRDRVHRVLRRPLVATVTLGSPRRFMIRPYGGGASLTITPCPGDLLVMGGAMQQDWEHCVPKTRRPVGPRMAITVRHSREARHSHEAEPGPADQ